MNKKRLAIAIGVVVFAMGALALGTQARFAGRGLFVHPDSANDRSAKATTSVSSLPPTRLAPGGSSLQTPVSGIPKHVVYGLLFHEITALKKKAEEMERGQKDASFLRNYHRRKAGLNDKQGEALDRVATDCQGALDSLDQQARTIIDRDRALHPGGRLNKGDSLPEPPQELKALEQQRIKTIMQAVSRLQGELGIEEFKRFDDFQQQDIGKRATQLSHAPHPTLVPAHGVTKHSRP